MHFAEAFGEVALVQRPYPSQVRAQWLDQTFRQHRYTVARPLAVAHRDLVPFEIDILDAQPQSFQQART